MRHFILTALILFSAFANAQDILKRKDGTELQVVVLSKDGKEIEYKLFNFQSGQSFKIDKKDVLFLQTKDGVTERFDEPVKQVVQPTTQSYSGSSSSAGENKELNQTLSKLSVAIDNLSKTQGGNSKPTNDAIIQLNQTISQLKETTEKSAAKSEQQNTEIISSLSELNKSIQSIKEINTGKEKEEIQLRKFGFGVNLVTNYMFASLLTSEGNYEEFSSFPGIFSGAGLNLIITSTIKKKVVFRYEPEFAISTGVTRGSTRPDFVIGNLGSRFLAVAKRNRVNIYGGPSIGFYGYYANGYGGGGFGFGTHFGGEYLLTSNFSINLETGFQVLTPFVSSASTVFSTYGRLGGRFYF